MKKLGLALVFLLSAALPALATTYYTAKDCSGGTSPPNCNDANNGTSRQTAELTIAAGLAHLAAGDTLIIGNGTYAEGIEYNAIPSGSDDAHHTIVQAENANMAILSGVGSLGQTIYIYTKSNVTLDGLVTDGGSANRVGIMIGGDSPYSDHILIQNGSVRNANVVDSGCITFSGPGGGNTYITIKNMKVYNCRGNQLQNHGIYNTAANSIFEFNDIYDNTGNGIESYYPGGGNDGNIFRGNIIHNNDNYGIEIATGQNQLVYNNVVYHNKIGGIRTGDSGTTGTRLYNNTIYDSYFAGYGHCITIDPSSTGAVVQNNICYNNVGNAIRNQGSSTSCTYNLGVQNGEGSTNSCSATPTASNPLFVSPGTGDFHLTALSPAIDTGTNLNAYFTIDFDGNTRTDPWDKGAFEFTSGTLPPSNNVRVSRFTFDCAGSAANLGAPNWAQTRTGGAVKVDGSGKCTGSTADSGGGGGAGSTVSNTSTNSSSSGTAVSVSAPTSTTTGDLVIVFLASNGTITHTDNNGSTPFTNRLNDYQGSGSGTNSVWSRIIQAGDPSTYNFTLSVSTRWTIHAVRITSPNATFLDGSIQTAADGTGTLTTADAPSVTTSFANSIHWIMFTSDGPSNAITSTPAGYTCPENSGDQSTAICYKVIASPSATGAQTFGWTNVSEYQTASFAIRDGGSGASNGSGWWARNLAYTPYDSRQYAGIKWNNSGTGGTGSRIGVGCRISPDTDTLQDGYQAAVYTVTGTQHTYLGKVVNGTLSELANITTTAWASGDTIWLECEGSRLWVLKNTTVIMFYTDTDVPLNTGIPGIVAAGDALGDDFVSGDLNVATGGQITVFGKPLHAIQ